MSQETAEGEKDRAKRAQREREMRVKRAEPSPTVRLGWRLGGTLRASLALTLGRAGFFWSFQGARDAIVSIWKCKFSY